MSNNPTSTPADAPAYIDQLLSRALKAGASDAHFEPVAKGMEVRLRIDGLLQTVEKLPEDLGRSAVLRLMVMGQLLTYRLDIPQEGRIRLPAITPGSSHDLDLRLAIMPVAHGLRAVIRLPAPNAPLHQNGGSTAAEGATSGLAPLGLPAQSRDALERFARADAGMLLVTGPAGSGKTTTIYALLEHIATTSPGLSIISLEDPIERLVTGITQIEVAPHGQMTYERAIKSILRQDPQVLMLGEIRDAATASLAIQAALSGHRLIATFHAGDPATAIQRLLEMGLEPYQITSSLFGVLAQRLVRRLAPAASAKTPALSTDMPKYKGRVPIAEFGEMSDAVRAAVLARADASALRNIFNRTPGHMTLRQIAETYVTSHITDKIEILRVLGE